MLQEGLHALLANDSAVQTIVGVPRTDGRDGVFPVTIPKNAPLPAMVYARIAGHENDTLDGRGDLRITRFQISCYATDTSTASGYDLAAALTAAAKDAILGFHGTLPDDDGTEVDDIVLVLEQETFDAVSKNFQSLFDVEVWFRNAS
jgi:Protein of unknown function (DUF3168)